MVPVEYRTLCLHTNVTLSVFLKIGIKNINNVAEPYVIETGMACVVMHALRKMSCGSYRHRL